MTPLKQAPTNPTTTKHVPAQLSATPVRLCLPWPTRTRRSHLAQTRQHPIKLHNNNNKNRNNNNNKNRNNNNKNRNNNNKNNNNNNDKQSQRQDARLLLRQLVTIQGSYAPFVPGRDRSESVHPHPLRLRQNRSQNARAHAHRGARHEMDRELPSASVHPPVRTEAQKSGAQNPAGRRRLEHGQSGL